MFNLAYYCLFKFGWSPSQIIKLSQREKAFLMASIEIYNEGRKR